ncbi:MAG: ATP-binding protein [Treponema sp.]|nr:ATP-binding protein [Treponema sp.]
MVIVFAFILLVVRFSTDDIVTELMQRRAYTANRELVNYVRTLQDSALMWAEAVSHDDNFIHYIINGDTDEIARYIDDYSMNMDSASVCDANGIIIVGSHSGMAGFNMSENIAVSAALRTGASSRSIEELITNGSFSICASAPIFYGGRLIGAVNFTYDLEKDSVLDLLSEEDGSSFTVFNGSTRINTTVLDSNGERATGTTAGENVVAAVIHRGEIYQGRQAVLGRIHEVCLSPLESGERVVGMLEAACDISVIIKKQGNMNNLIIVAFLMSLAVAAIIIILSKRAYQKNDMLNEKLFAEKEASLGMLEKMLHTMDCFIYVTELETDRILFVNDGMIKGFGLTGNIKGEHCWKHFQKGFDKRCDFCPKNKLEVNPEGTIVWEERNSVTGRYYRHIDRIIDWSDGTKVHFQQCDDVTELKSALALEKQLRQETLMASISRSFLSDTSINDLITENLRLIGEFMEIPQALFFSMEEDGTTLTCRNEWIDPKLGLASRIGGILPLKDPMLSMIAAFKPGTGKDSCLHSNDPVIKEAMAPYRVSFKNYIATPVFCRGKMIGVIDFSRVDDGGQWSESDINLTTLFAATLSGVFERDAMERQYSIVENTPSIILYVDPDGNLAYFNPALINVTGYSEEEIEADGFNLIFDEQTVREIKEIYIPQTLQNGIDSREVILKCKDGRRRILETSTFIAQKDTIAAIAVDVTEERALKAELIAAKEMAENASRAKSEFMSRMSHEMRTPMNAIMGMTYLARGAGNPEKMDNYLEKADSASRHLLQLIDDVLDLTGIEDGNFGLVHLDFSFKAMIDHLMDTVNMYAGEKKQKISVDIDPTIPDSLRGDEKRLMQAINNIMANAVKFTPNEGMIELKVSVLGEENRIITLQIEIADNGVGILKDQQQAIFNPFEQAYGGIDREFGGIGLGLPLSRRIIELMGGTIWVESAPGKGSKFIFTVKVGRGHSENVQPGSTGLADSSLEDKTALLVEDNKVNQEILVSMLANTNLNIECAEDGQEALDMFTANPSKYDIIFMDISMPVMDGVEATRRIRTHSAPEGARVPIIAVTANILPEDVKSYLAVGMNDHIGKPVDYKELMRKLEKYIHLL